MFLVLKLTKMRTLGLILIALQCVSILAVTSENEYLDYEGSGLDEFTEMLPAEPVRTKTHSHNSANPSPAPVDDEEQFFEESEGSGWDIPIEAGSSSGPDEDAERDDYYDYDEGSGLPYPAVPVIPFNGHRPVQNRPPGDFDWGPEPEEEPPVEILPEKPSIEIVKVPEEPQHPSPATEAAPTYKDEEIGMDSPIQITTKNDEDRQVSVFAQPSILAAFIGGAVVGLLCAILLVMFIVYRMRKRDEGSYPLDEPKRLPLTSSYAPNEKEIYA